MLREQHLRHIYRSASVKREARTRTRFMSGLLFGFAALNDDEIQESTMPQGRILLGWMQRDEAVAWLRQHCEFNPPLTEAAAEDRWNEYRQRVEALDPRSVVAPNREGLNRTEQDIADRFIASMRARGATNVRVIKINPLSLGVRQLYVNTDRSAEHRAAFTSRAALVRRLIPTAARPAAQLNVELRPPGYCIRLPHGEFGLGYVLNAPQTTFMVQQMGDHVTVAETHNRTILWAGYHRSFGFATMLQPDSQGEPELTDRTLVAALVTNVPVSPSEANLITGLRAPVLADFFDPRFFMAVTLRRKRYELQISAKLEWIDA